VTVTETLTLTVLRAGDVEVSRMPGGTRASE
jgi:hypothetical protein